MSVSQRLACQVNEHIFQRGLHHVQVHDACAIGIEPIDDTGQDGAAVGGQQVHLPQRVGARVTRGHVLDSRKLAERLGHLGMPPRHFQPDSILL